METLHVINELMEIVFLVIGLKLLYEIPYVALKKKSEIILNIAVVIMWMFLCLLWFDVQAVFLFCRFVVIGLYICIIYRRHFLDAMLKVITLLVCVDILNLILAFATYPFAIIMVLEKEHIIVKIIAIIVHVIGYMIILTVIANRKPVILWSMIESTKKGIFIICMVIEIVFIGMKTASYQKDDIGMYLLWFAFIVFGITILVLWLRDKKKQHDKMVDLISYEHRTREIIPAIEKTLQDVKKMGTMGEEKEKILEELRAVRSSELGTPDVQARRVKSFSSTGSTMLDNQMEQYIDESIENDILLDVIVRAPVTCVLKEDEIEIYPLMQIVGDLYRNAFKAVDSNKYRKNILFCFGYNSDGFYEIGIYDNGHPFPKQILEHFGERGNTIGGTGHGIADILDRLNKYRVSFVLEENPASGTLFTKGIHIIFNDEANVEIK